MNAMLFRLHQFKVVNKHVMMCQKLFFFFSFQKLGSPTLTVTNESFVPMLSRMDECILYIKNNVSTGYFHLHKTVEGLNVYIFHQFHIC